MKNNKILIYALNFLQCFIYYGLQAITVYYFIAELSISSSEACDIFGRFVFFVFGLIPLGGLIADKLYGTIKTIAIGFIILIIGYLMLIINNIHVVFMSLGFIAVGNCLIKSNLNTEIAVIYKNAKSILNKVFTIIYLIINIAALLSIFLFPILISYWGNYVFLLSAFIAVIAVVLISLSVDKENYKIRKNSYTDYMFILLILLCCVFIGVILESKILSNVLTISLLLIFVSYYYIISMNSKHKEKKRMYVSFILIIESIVFFVLYRQIPTLVNLYTIQNIKITIGKITINPMVFQSLNAFWIFLLSLILILFSSKKNKYRLKMSTKFIVGNTLSGCAFIFLFINKYILTNYIHVTCLILFYFMISLGELFISALGPSMISKFIPEKNINFAMGLWYFSLAISGKISGVLASNIVTNEHQSYYYASFLFISVIVLIVCALFYLIKPWIDSNIPDELNI